MIDDTSSITCTATERDLLDMIACSPGTPAVATIYADDRYRVPTLGGWEKGGAVAERANAAIAGPLGMTRISHGRATTAARRLIGSHFGWLEKPRITVPPRWDEDDDFVLLTYIQQQRAAEVSLSNKVENNDAR